MQIKGKAYMVLNGSLVKVSDISFVGKLDRHINHDMKSSSVNYYIPMIVGGQRIEIKGNTKEETEELRK